MNYPPVRPVFVLALFAAIASVSAAGHVVSGGGRGETSSVAATVVHSGFIWMLFGILSFISIYASRRFPLERKRLTTAIPAHLAAFLTISVTHTVLYTLFLARVIGRPGADADLRAAALGNLRGDIFLYAMMIGAYYLYAQSISSRERARIAADLTARTAELESSLSAALAQPAGGGAGYLTRVPLKDNGRVEFVETGDLERIEADGDYVRLHAGGTSRLLRQSLSSLERQLDPRQFARVHRSTIVSIARIGELQPMFHGEFVAVMASGAKVKVSRTYRAALMEALGVSA